MPRPVTPFVGCDVFIPDEAGRVLLIRRSDSGFWAMPGGCQDLGETPAECAVRECHEETGLTVRLVRLLGVFSSQRYEYANYPWKGNEFSHLVFHAEVIAGQPTITSEASEIAYFAEDGLPPLSDGHGPRIQFGFRALRDFSLPPFFE